MTKYFFSFLQKQNRTSTFYSRARKLSFFLYMRRPRQPLREGDVGFTLVELIVVIAVMATLSILFVGGFRSSGDSLALNRSARTLVQLVDQARALSLSGAQHKGVAVSGGFGIFVQEGTSEIYLFADCNGDGDYQENGASSSCPEGESELMEIVSFEQRISLGTVTPCTAGACTLTIRFIPPYASSSFTPTLTGTEAVFILTDTAGNTEEVRVNTLGVATII